MMTASPVSESPEPLMTAPRRHGGSIATAKASQPIRALAAEAPRRGRVPVAALIGVGVAIGVAITRVYLLLIR